MYAYDILYLQLTYTRLGLPLPPSASALFTYTHTSLGLTLTPLCPQLTHPHQQQQPSSHPHPPPSPHTSLLLPHATPSLPFLLLVTITVTDLNPSRTYGVFVIPGKQWHQTNAISTYIRKPCCLSMFAWICSYVNMVLRFSYPVLYIFISSLKRLIPMKLVQVRLLDEQIIRK